MKKDYKIQEKPWRASIICHKNVISYNVIEIWTQIQGIIQIEFKNEISTMPVILYNRHQNVMWYNSTVTKGLKLK